MITAELPFSGDSVHTIIYKHILRGAAAREAPSGPASPGRSQWHVSRALAKEPDQRFAHKWKNLHKQPSGRSSRWLRAAKSPRRPLGRAPGRRPMRLRDHGRAHDTDLIREKPRKRLHPRGAGRGPRP